jgi:hypothetical protein
MPSGIREWIFWGLIGRRARYCALSAKLQQLRGRAIVIRVVSKYPLSEEARRFCEKIRSFLADAGYRIEFEHHPLDTE